MLLNFRNSLPICAVLLGISSLSFAIPVIDKSQSVADYRRDKGTGLCGTATHDLMPTADPSKLWSSDVTNQKFSPLAIDVMNTPITDANRTKYERANRIFGNLNFHNGQPNTGGDFTIPTSPDEFFPYTQDPTAKPPGNDSNFTFRLRGYLNISPTQVKTQTFALSCDDTCALTIGTTQVYVADHLRSARVIKQVTFTDPGLYPIEILYAQNGSTAYLELARGLSVVPECPNDICGISLTNDQYKGAFQLLQSADLYSAVIGENKTCQECGVQGLTCDTGNYCSDGLCQACLTANHCGPNCAPCSDSTHPACSASGACVECNQDIDCKNGFICSGNACVAPPACSEDSECGSMKICEPNQKICVFSCTSDETCPAGNICDPNTKGCFRKVSCSANSDCADNQTCDTDAQLCKPKTNNGGCHVTTPGALQTTWLVLVLGTLLSIGIRSLFRKKVAN